jgi:hypothetical protein
MKLYRLFSLLKSFTKRTNPQREVEFIIDNMTIICKLTYYRKTKVLEYKYYVSHGTCMEYQIPNSNRRFAKRMLKDFDKEIAQELYMDDENLLS